MVARVLHDHTCRVQDRAEGDLLSEEPMSNYILRWYSNGDHAEETFTDQAAVLARISELAVSGKECRLYEEIPVKLRVTASLPRRYRNGSPAGSPNNARPPGVPAAEPAGDVEPAAVTNAGPQHRWGRIGSAELGAWHLFPSDDAGEALCWEAIGPEVEVHFLEEGELMSLAQRCVDCDAISRGKNPHEPGEHEVGELNDGNATIVRTAPVELEPVCEHKNEAAGVACTAKATAGKVNGKWSCKRHSRRTSDALREPQGMGPAATEE